MAMKGPDLLTARQLDARRADVYLRIGEAVDVLSLPAPAEVHAYGHGVLSLFFAHASQAKQWDDHLCLTAQHREWRGWKTYTHGMA